jgi:hypothetical protein
LQVGPAKNCQKATREARSDAMHGAGASSLAERLDAGAMGVAPGALRSRGAARTPVFRPAASPARR